jgi:hypothetical protein
MPRSLTWKQLLWTGVVLSVVGLAARLYLVSFVFAIGGNDAINNIALQWVQTGLGQVAFQLGIAVLALLLVIWAIGGTQVAVVTPAPRALVVTFWAGVVLIVLGLILQSSLAAWQWGLSGANDVGRGLARDVLFTFGAPLEAAGLPLGTLLVAGSIVVRTVAIATGPQVAAAERI